MVMLQHATLWLYACVIMLDSSVLSLELGPNRTPQFQTRRSLLISATAAAALTSPRPPTAAALTEPETRTPQSSPRPTALVTLDLSIARSPVPRPLRIELFGDETPESVSFFSRLASNTLPAKCADDAATSEICFEYRNLDVGYVNSQVWRLVPNRRIDFGRVDSMFSARVPPTFASERRSSGPGSGRWERSSTRGAVSVKRGGGAFEFTIAPVDNPALEKEDLVVVGRVVEEDMVFLDEIHAIPTRRDIISIGDVPPLGGNFARACDFTSPDKTCAQYKPLKKIVVVSSSVASL